MEIRPAPDQEAFIRQAIDAGRIARSEDAATQAMALWEERERRRAEILAHVDEAEAALTRGEGTVITAETVSALAEDIGAGAAPAWRRRTPRAADGALERCARARSLVSGHATEESGLRPGHRRGRRLAIRWK
jgi:hypothetical protein